MKKPQGDAMYKQAKHLQRKIVMNFGRRFLAPVVVVMALPLAVFGQLLDQPQTPVSAKIAHRLQISSGDLLEVGVFDTPELSGKLRVNEEGEIALPVAGPLRVGGPAERCRWGHPQCWAHGERDPQIRSRPSADDPHGQPSGQDY